MADPTAWTTVDAGRVVGVGERVFAADGAVRRQAEIAA
jgi:hypothetical protein